MITKTSPYITFFFRLKKLNPDITHQEIGTTVIHRWTKISNEVSEEVHMNTCSFLWCPLFVIVKYNIDVDIKYQKGDI
jgi:hypothetical protein